MVRFVRPVPVRGKNDPSRTNSQETLFILILPDSEKSLQCHLLVNRSPSLGSSSPFDKELKQSMIKNVLKMVLLTSRQIDIIKREEHSKSLDRLTNPSVTRSLSPKERILAEFQEQKEIKMMGNFRMLYPVEDDRYDEVRRMSFSLDGRNADKSKTNSIAKDD
ncbi:hypothetical protein AVEN_56056-1 [Araneus ventricosus]|uniref:Uncharacterized protein n=1 Tax=Araneus ventricosus TaxID=182803 RepID=A0A4Y2SN00_ARAVE|nr:hypothetical protein AVEN_56056-1 [Araneus ventricosus]